MKTLKHIALGLSLLSPLVLQAEVVRPKPRPVSFVQMNSENKDIEQEIATFKISLSMSFSNIESLDRAFETINSPTYGQYMSSYQEAGKISTVNKLEQEYLKQNNADEYQSLSVRERALRLQEFSTNFVEDAAPVGMIVSELMVNDMIDNPHNWRESLESSKDLLSFEEKINVATRLGGRFLGDYNNGRADGSRDAEGIISIEQMLQNLRNNSAGGVCRDIALAQSQILRELGVGHENIYIMGYATANNNHAVMAVQDPNDPNRVLRINYNYAESSTNVAGGGALNISGRLTNVGTVYRLYDADGKPVETVSSEIGQVLKEVTNGEQKFETGIRSYSIQKVQMESKWGRATLFQGKTHSNGDDFTGLALDTRIHNTRTGENYEVGLAIVNREGSERLEETLDQQMLYARIKYWIEKQRQVGRVLFTGIMGTEAEFAYMNSKVTRRSDQSVKEGTNFDTNTKLFTGIEGEITSSNGKTTYGAGVIGYGYFDFKNVAAGTSGGTTLALDRVETHAKVGHQLNANIIANGEVLITNREVGSTVTFTAGVEARKSNTLFEVSYHRPLTDIPIFFEGSTEVISVRGYKRWENSRAKRKGAGGASYVEYQHDKDTGQNQAGVGFEIKW